MDKMVICHALNILIYIQGELSMNYSLQHIYEKYFFSFFLFLWHFDNIDIYISKLHLTMTENGVMINYL